MTDCGKDKKTVCVVIIMEIDHNALLQGRKVVTRLERQIIKCNNNRIRRTLVCNMGAIGLETIH